VSRVEQAEVLDGDRLRQQRDGFEDLTLGRRKVLHRLEGRAADRPRQLFQVGRRHQRRS